MDHLVGSRRAFPIALSVGAVCGNYDVGLLAVLKVHMVNTRSMVAQQDHDNGVNVPKASVSNGACSETPRVGVLERKIQGLTMDVQLLMK